MATETKQDPKVEKDAKAKAGADSKDQFSKRPARGGRKSGPRRGRPGRRGEDREFEQRILSLDRVTRVTKGGKRMRFRAAMIIGDQKGRVGYGVSKATDVANAVNKAITQAKKKMQTIPIVDETIPHEISQKYGAARVMLKPAPKGTGIKAGGAVRVVLELGGVPNVTAKILGSKSKLNNAKATLAALRRLRSKPASAKPEAAKASAEDADKKKEGN